MPWKYNSTTYQSNLLASNCTSSFAPDQELDYWSAYYAQRTGAKQSDCSNGFQDACAAMQSAFACLSGAVNLAASTSPFPIPEIHTSGDIDTYGTAVKDAARDYIAQSAAETITGNSAVTGGLFDIFDTFSALSHAYNSCAP